MGIEVLAEPEIPLQIRGAEAARQARFGSTVALGQFTELGAEGLTTLRALFTPLTRVESALMDFLRAADVDIPPDLDQRDYAHRLIAVRRGQRAFRQGLMRAFDRTCCISGSRVEATLEAAHIRPFRETGSHAPGNGLLLRADLHTLFDLRLVTVLPYGTVRVAPDLRGSEYEDFDERQARRPVDPGHVPLREALAEHNALCGWLN